MRIPTIGDPGGFALGSRTMQTLETLGIRQTGWRWRYDPSIARPTGSYPEHRVLAGAHLVELPSPDGYYPGDHRGCRCLAMPVLRGPDGRFVASDGTVSDDGDE